MRRALAPLAVTVTLATALAPGSAQVEPPDPRYVGRYVYDGTTAQAQAALMEALAPELERLNPLLRMMLESRMREEAGDRMPFPRRIDIGLDGDRVRVVLGYDRRERRYETRLGYPEEVRGERVTQLFRDGHLEQVFGQRPAPSRYHVLSLDRGGNVLTLRIAMRGNVELPGEPRRQRRVSITLPYRRR